MTRRTASGVIFAVLVLAAMAFFLFRPAEKPMRRSVTFTTMGTIARFDWYATEKVAGEATFAANAAFQQVVSACNLRDKKSELSRLNATADKEPFVCSDTLWGILTEARRAYQMSGGAFDITVKPLMDLWGFYRKRETLPPPGEIAAVRRLVGMERVIWDDAKHSVFFSVKNMALDLDGIAKGYALDRAAEAAMRCGVTQGVLDLGGNLRLLAPFPGQKSFSVGIRTPDGSRRTKPCEELANLAGNVGISTSGNYERFVVYQGKRYGHILDAKTGFPAEYRYSATVVAPDAVTADWMSTTCYLRPDLAQEFRKKGIIAVLVEP